MATVRKNIVISEEQDAWIKAQIESGQYANYSECIRGLIRHEQKRCDSAEAIRPALISGEGSGEPLPFDPEAFKQSMSNMN
jgi:antitoxin ParD1/3/4